MVLFDIVHIIDFITGPIVATWIWAIFFLKIFNRSSMVDLIANIRPFVLPGMVINVIDHIHHGMYLENFGWFIAILDLFDFVLWHWFKDVGNDDRWKKRMKKVAGKVKALASGRLVVVPNNA